MKTKLANQREALNWDDKPKCANITLCIAETKETKFVQPTPPESYQDLALELERHEEEMSAHHAKLMTCACGNTKESVLEIECAQCMQEDGNCPF